MLLRDIIRKGTETVSRKYPEREAREMVFVLLEHILGTKRHTHIVEPEYGVEDTKVAEVEAGFERLASGEPLQYVTGTACFYGRDFHVSPAVLIPRPETELLCRTALDIYQRRSGCKECGNGIFPPSRAVGKQPSGLLQRTACGSRYSGRGPQRGRGPLEHFAFRPYRKILDLCTGSGCIAWTMALECPGAEVTAADISDAALETACNQNFADEQKQSGARTPVFIKADVLSGPEALNSHNIEDTFDLILSNPPYVMDKEKALMRENVLDHEPHLALFVPDNDPLLFYRAVAAWAVKLLSPDGTGIVEINEALGPETAQVFSEAGFSHTEVLKDLTERDRFVLFRR